MAAPATDDKKNSNNVRVSLNKSRFLYVDVTKYLLEEGHATVEISGLGQAIADVVDIVEILKSQKLVVVTKINTTRNIDGAHRQNTDRISVTVKKSADFDRVFAEHKKQKEAAKAEKAAAAGEKTA